MEDLGGSYGFPGGTNEGSVVAKRVKGRDYGRSTAN